MTATQSRSPAPSGVGAQAGATPAVVEWDYRPYLDGLRAVAVYLVLAFHAGLLRWEGGFIGVDVFFVLSGFLVTNLLVRDLVGNGRIGFARFYSRRVRRLLPAAMVNLVIVAVVFRAIATPVEYAAGRASIRSAALYVSNWYFIREAADYFGTAITSSPVAQYWSLSVEEQFYVVWPLLIYALFRLGRRLRRSPLVVARVAVVVGGLVSVGAALHIATYNPNRAYYGTDTRAYQLLAGALLALTPSIFERLRRSRMTRALGPGVIVLLIALVVLATSAVDVGPITRGCLVTVLTAGILLALECAENGQGRALLSVGPLTYLGRISYGTYLWHWIVILVATKQLDMAPLTTFAVTTAVATGLAALSFEVLEHPIRRSVPLGRYSKPVIAAGLALSLLVALAIAPSVLDVSSSPASASAATTGAALAGTPNHANWAAAYFDVAHVGGKCNPAQIERCVVVHGSRGTIVLAGESHAAMLEAMVAKLARREHYELVFAPLAYCPWTLGIKYAGFGPTCLDDQRNIFDKVVPKVDPDIVILAHRTVDDPLNPLVLSDAPGHELTKSSQREQALRSSITALVHDLRARHSKVVLIEPVPVSKREDDPEKCLSKAKFLEQCRYVATVGPTGEEKIYRDLAAADAGVVSVDLDRLVCPYLPICDPVVRGLVVKRDDTHLTRTFANSLLDPFSRILVTAGVFQQ
jgi:peptidoglycan/LPS O-acetylase OafA/YrhL